jgi:hypothetical protein
MEAFEDSSSDSTAEIMSAKTLRYSAELNCTAVTISYAGNMTNPSVNQSIPDAFSFLVNVVGRQCETSYTVTNRHSVDTYMSDRMLYRDVGEQRSR